jgi:hypothetical protein
MPVTRAEQPKMNSPNLMKNLKNNRNALFLPSIKENGMAKRGTRTKNRAIYAHTKTE